METVLVQTLKEGDVFIHGGIMFTVLHARDKLYTCIIGETDKGVYLSTSTAVQIFK